MSCFGIWSRGRGNRLERNNTEAEISVSDSSAPVVRSVDSQLVAISTLQGSPFRVGSSRPAAEPVIPFRSWDMSNDARQDGAEQNAQREAVTSDIGTGPEGLRDEFEFSAPDSILGAVVSVGSATLVMRGAGDELPTRTDSSRPEVSATRMRNISHGPGVEITTSDCPSEVEILRSLLAKKTEEADSERQRADRERQEKEAETQRAERERERAEAEKKRADRESEHKETAQKRMRGDFWLTITALLPVLQKQESSEKYKKTVEAGGASDCIFGKFLPELDWLRKSHGVPLDKESLHRSAPDFTHGVWNESLDDSGEHRAHLVPFSWDCCMEWLCLFMPFVVLGTLGVLGDIHLRELGLCMMVGLKLPGQGKGVRYKFSGFLHSFINFIPLRGQGTLIDLDPRIMFLPLLTFSEILFWNGQPYHCLIIGKSAHDMMHAGFHYVRPQLDGDLADAESFCELSTDDQSVINAFENFNVLLTLVVPFLASQTIKTVDTMKTALCSIFRAFLAQVTRSGTVPDVMCPTVPKGKVVVCLKFQRRDPQFPTFEEGAPALSGRAQEKLTALPHPFLLFLRALNAWFNCLHSRRSWPDWNAYLENELKKNRKVEIKGEWRKLSSKGTLVLLPSCRDMDMDTCTCMLCKAADVFDNPELYPVVSDDEWRAVTSVQDPTASPISEEEAEMISMLRRRLISDGAWEADVGNEAEALRDGGDEAPGKAEDERDSDALCSTRTTVPELPV